MKKLIKVFFISAALVLLLCSSAAGENKGNRKLTLMVYMCGSNLESLGACGSIDILEMQNSILSDSNLSVLVMTGGSKVIGSPYFQNNAVKILEISAGKSRCVWQSEQPLNMGASGTLTQFLTYGKENYPAKEFALILWDHGGGPLAGVCMDEQYDMDCLTLSELTEGLRKSYLLQKFSWIGFDACLMSTVEVAEAMAPYAHYMIASQEAEPASGWDYSFLKDLDKDKSGADTGRRIIDSYFQSLKGSMTGLTMSCVDLEQIAEVRNTLDDFFKPIAQNMKNEDFNRLSEIRLATTGFGKDLPDIGIEGYDLVDLMDLIERYGGMNSITWDALDKAIVYSRSNLDHANGLSAYHPYLSKQKYLTAWKDDYNSLHFSSGYTRYIERFGAFLTGESTVDWADLFTLDLDTDENGTHRFALRLTPEQQADFASAQLFILQDPYHSNKKLDNGYLMESGEPLTLVASVNLVSEQNGILYAEYDNRLLYVLNEDNQILVGPISYYMNNNSPDIYVRTEYSDLSENPESKPDQFVFYDCRMAENSNDYLIANTYVYDSAMQVLTNRLPFSEDDYSLMYFFNLPNSTPDTGKIIPGFFSWDTYRGYSLMPVSLPEKWHLRMCEEKRSSDLYAMFQITDTRQNTYSSIPIKIQNNQKEQCILEPDAVETDDFLLDFSLTAIEEHTKRYVALDTHCVNKTDKEINVKTRELILNGEISLSNGSMPFIYYFLDPGEEKTSRDIINIENLTGFDEITRIDGIIDLTLENNYPEEDTVKSIPFHIEVRNCDVSGIAPRKQPAVGEYQDGEITWQVASLEQDRDGSISGLLYVQNESDEPFTADFCDLYLNKMLVETHLHFNASPHTGCYVPFTTENVESVSFLRLHIGNRSESVLMENVLQRHNIQTIDHVDLTWNMYTVSIPLTTPLELPEDNSNQSGKMKTLLSENGLFIGLEGILSAEDGVAVLLYIRNDSDTAVHLECPKQYLDGQEPRFNEFGRDLTVPAGTQMMKTVPIRLENPPSREDLHDLRLEFSIWNGSHPVTISFPEGTVMESGKLSWLLPDSLTVTSEKTADMSNVLPDSIQVSPDSSAEKKLLIAPFSAEECRRSVVLSADICTMELVEATTRDNDKTNCISTRELTSLFLEPDSNGIYSAEYSGLVLTANEIPIPVTELLYKNNTWSLSCNLFYYSQVSDYSPVSGSSDLYSTHSHSYIAALDITANLASGNPQIQGYSTFLCDKEDNMVEDKKDLPRDEIALVAFDRMVNLYPVSHKSIKNSKYSDPGLLKPEDGISLMLVPVSSLNENLCIRYTVYFDDGGKEIIVDWKTGETLYEEEW